MEFIENRWYRLIDKGERNSIWYVKNYLNDKRLDCFGECIQDGYYQNRRVNLGEHGYYQYELVDLSEIRQYLSEGHPDLLIKDESEPEDLSYLAQILEKYNIT